MAWWKVSWKASIHGRGTRVKRRCQRHLTTPADTPYNLLIQNPKANRFPCRVPGNPSWSFPMKLVSWNVNGIRAVLRKDLFLPFVAAHDPDVICLQETKAHPQQVELDLPSHPYQYWHSAEKKGYAGTAIFSKREPVSVSYGIGVASFEIGRASCRERV